MIPQQFLDQLIEGFIITLRADESWRGDLTDDEREVWIKAASDYLHLHCIKKNCEYEDAQLRIRLALRVFALTSKKRNDIEDIAEE